MAEEEQLLINGIHEAVSHKISYKQQERECMADFKVSKKYKNLKFISRGGSGVVCQATETDTNKTVAIKMIDLEKCPRIISVFRELQISKYMSLRESKALTKLMDIQIPAKKDGADKWDFDRIYLVFEYFPSDLSSIIKSNIKMNDDDYRRLLANMLFGLRDLHYSNIVHRDIKPTNMLVEKLENLKLCDYGLARAMNRSHADTWMVYKPPIFKLWSDDENTTEEVTATKVIEKNKTSAKKSSSAEATPEEELTTLQIKQRYEEGLTNGLGTIGYRAPELTLNCEVYHKPADIWAVGCVFAEMVTKNKLFKFEGESNEEQFNAIISKMGSSFITEDLKFIDNREGLKLATKKRKESLSAPKLSADFKNLDENGEEILLLDTEGVKLLEKFLKFHPEDRITVQNALRSPYFSRIYKELKLKYGYPKLEVQIEKEKEKQQSEEQFKEKLWSEMLYFHGYQKRAEPKADEKHKRKRKRKE